MASVIGSLVLLTEAIIGFWLMEGYHNSGWYKRHPNKKKPSDKRPSVSSISEAKGSTLRTKIPEGIGTLVLAILPAAIPWGQGMIDQHPCVAWALWFASFLLGTHLVLSWVKSGFLVKMALGMFGAAIFGYVATQSLNYRTEPMLLYLHPGAILNGNQEMLVISAHTHRPIFNADVWLQDEVTHRAIRNEPDSNKVTAMNQGSIWKKTYPEIDPVPKIDKMADFLLWLPINIGDQEYSFWASMRVGDNILRVKEQLLIKGLDPHRGYAILVEDDESNKVLMKCKHKDFPSSSEWPSSLPECVYDRNPVTRHSWIENCLGLIKQQ